MSNIFKSVVILYAVALLTLLCLPSTCSASTSCDIFGVSPDDCDRYKSSQYFYCGGGKDKKIPMKYVNDDYCDCVASGDDEPATSACNGGRFWCENRGYKGRYIYSSLVNDGLCDCCDGSDEASNPRVECRNSCAQKAQQELSRFVAEKRKLSEGLKMKHSLMQVASSKLGEQQTRRRQLEKEVSEKKAALRQKEVQKQTAEEKERVYKQAKEEERERRRAQAIAECQVNGGEHCEPANNDDDNKDSESDAGDEDGGDGESDRVRQRRERREQRFAERASRNEERQQQQKEAEEALQHHEHTPDEEFPYPEQYRPHSEEAEEESEQQPPQHHEHHEHTPGEEFPYPEQYRPHDDDEDTVKEEEAEAEFDWSEFDDVDDMDDMDDGDDIDDDDMEAPIAADVATQEKDPVMDEISNAVRSARDEYNNVNRDIQNLEKDLKEIDKVLGNDFGDKNVLASLLGECYSTKIAKYEYEFCPFEKASQKEGHSSTNLGTFKSFKNEQNEMVMVFEEGQKCWNGPKRSMNVVFKCDLQNEVVSVTEPSTCRYQMTFHSPLACLQSELDAVTQILNQYKTEL